jgi:para-aminobenzoate synthetase
MVLGRVGGRRQVNWSLSDGGRRMVLPTSELRDSANVVVADVRRLQTGRARPLLVAIDGASGSGKSVLAALVAARLGAALVPVDDFFAAQLADADWDARTPAERAADALDWRRLRAEALVPLLAGWPARWHPFDFSAGARPDGSYGFSTRAEGREPKRVVLVEGAYACRPELADLIDWSVLVDAPVEVRHRRLARRENPQFLAAWHARWDAAERWYFSQVRPESAFDRVVTNVGSQEVLGRSVSR